jgi:hypothetical protein
LCGCLRIWTSSGECRVPRFNGQSHSLGGPGDAYLPDVARERRVDSCS